MSLTPPGSELASLKGVEDTGKFRIQNKQLHLTYAGHLVPSDLLAFIDGICGIEKYSVVHETGKESEYLHTHALIGFGKNFQSTNCRIFDFNDIHPNIKRVSTPQHWNNCVKYHYKEGVPTTNINPPVDTPSIVNQIWACDSPLDAVQQHCSKPSQVNGIVTIYTMKPIDYGPEPEVDWHSWQRELLDEVSEKAQDDRKVMWYYDPVGNHGKTFMAKHLAKYYDAYVTTKANTYHVATMIQELLKRGKQPELVVFNFTRQQEDHKVYECIESLKDGLITAQKYVGQTLVFDSPHVVVFANYLPDVSTMSQDRWDIKLLMDKRAVSMPVDYVASLPEDATADTIFADANKGFERINLLRPPPGSQRMMMRTSMGGNRSGPVQSVVPLTRTPVSLPSSTLGWM